MSLNTFVRACNDRLTADTGVAHALLRSARGRVTARFCDVDLASVLDPIRLSEAPALTVGYIARLQSTVNQAASVPVSGRGHAGTDAVRVVNFDRLCRTLHMLNFLGGNYDPAAQLVLDVDPRHILNVPRDHGAYFAGLIEQCGLATERVVLSTSLDFGAKPGDYLHRLGQGLANYRSRGYRIGVRLDELPMSKATAHFFFRVAPDYLRLDARRFARSARSLPSGAGRYLGLLQRLMFGFGGRVVLEHIEKAESLVLAADAGIEWIQGPLLERRRRERRGGIHWQKSPRAKEGTYVQAI